MSANTIISKALGEQYGAALTMLENTVINCDEDLWQDYKRETVISQVIYHTLFFVDYYLSKNKSERGNFKAKLGDDLMGERTDGMEWNKIFSRVELLDYLQVVRIKADKYFKNLTIETLNSEPVFEWHGNSVLSSLLYDLRHIMLHVGALHVRLNAVGKKPLKWVSKEQLL